MWVFSKLPTTSSFNSTVKDIVRYQRIKDALQDETSVPFIAFVAFIANDFEIFLKTFQSMKPKIHLIYSEMSKLLIAMMSKFIKSKILNVDKNGSKSYKDVNELLTVNVQDPKNCKPLKMIKLEQRQNLISWQL